MGSVVVGVEGDIGFMDLSGHGTAPSSDPTKQQDLRLESGLYGTATGRLGFVVGKSLIYGKGGWAYLDATASQTTTKPGYVTNPTKAFNGWVWGGGIEHFLSPGVSVKAEYLHFDFGSQLGDQTSVSDDPIGFKYVNKTDVTAGHHESGHLHSLLTVSEFQNAKRAPLARVRARLPCWCSVGLRDRISFFLIGEYGFDKAQ